MSRLGTRFNDEALVQTALGTEIKISQASLAASWRRSSSFGLDPNGRPVDAVLSEVDLHQAKQKNEDIKQFVKPELELLYNQIAGTNFMVAYADNTGVVLNALRDEEFKNSDAGRAVIPGSIWTEEYRGTNALGLCLQTGTSQIVAGRDHFFRKLGDLSCFAAPIYGPNDEIVGMIDATSDASLRQNHTLALVKLACKNVENRLFIDAFRNSSIISFHARHEYLSTTSAALLAVDEHGFIEGANANAKSMLNGLTLSNKSHFGDVFEIPFSSIITRLSSQEIIRIYDAMGSAVFMALQEPTSKRIVELDARRGVRGFSKKLGPQSANNYMEHEQVSKPKQKYIADDAGLKRHLKQANRALQLDLPVLLVGNRGTGKKTTAIELHTNFRANQPFVEVKCALLTEENYEKMLFGSDGKLSYFQHEFCGFSESILSSAKGGSLFLNGIEGLPKSAQTALAQVLEARQEVSIGDYENKIAGVFVSSRLSIQELRAQPDIDAVFLENILGAQVIVPNLAQRLDFRAVASELLRQISDAHKFSKPALDALERLDWPGHIKQLKKTIQILVASSDGPIIRIETVQGDQNLSGEEIMPCDPCSQSPVRKESCILIKKTWLESGGNISLVSRRLGVSRTTIYKHINKP